MSNDLVERLHAKARTIVAVELRDLLMEAGNTIAAQIAYFDVTESMLRDLSESCDDEGEAFDPLEKRLRRRGLYREPQQAEKAEGEQ